VNKDQRAYLLKEISNAHAAKVKKLKDTIPQKPSLNNHLVAAVIEGSAEMADLGKLKNKIRETVLRMGSSLKLVKTESSKNRYSSWDSDDENGDLHLVNLLVEDIFKLPKSYLDALQEWETIKNSIEAEIDALNATMHTITMKVNLGSSEKLQKLVEQVDNMDDINIVNQHLTLASSGEALTLPSSKKTGTTKQISQ
jgi:hypothetical protein